MTLTEIKMSMRWGCFCLFSLALAGCVNDDVSDLTQYIASVKAKPKGPIQALPEIAVVEPFVFNPEGLRDPFRHVEKVEEEEPIDISSGTGIVPDTTRRKEELESYPLDTLQMVGTLTMDERLWGLIKASDGTIHRIRKGNYMGRNYGEIIRILGDRVELMEIVLDKPGSWIEQQASLQLVE
ncbi:MAG: pilus assembly protein PilP [Methylococcales bacterium]|nr:pilus assembly protein PilP [Methylococcales bacterium]